MYIKLYDDKKHSKRFLEEKKIQEEKDTERYEQNQKEFEYFLKSQKETDDKRIDRFIKSNKPPLLFAIDEIISLCIIEENNKEFILPIKLLCLDLPFEEIEIWLKNLQKIGCFENIEHFSLGNSLIGEFIIKRPNIEKLKKTRKELIQKLSFGKEKNQDKKSFCIDTSGDINYKGKKIQFSNKKSTHYLLLCCLLNESDADDFCSYKEILEYFQKNGIKTNSIQTVRNARDQLFTRVKINNKKIENLLDDKKTKIIETIRGDGYKLNNLEIK